MNLLQINVTANWGSHGKIAEAIGDLVLKEGGKSYMAYGRGNPTSSSKLIRIGSDFDMRCHGVSSRLFDNHGLCSVKTTKEFISKIPSIKPDIIHLHNIHGYYLNYEILFDFLKNGEDLWSGPFTIVGHLPVIAHIMILCSVINGNHIAVIAHRKQHILPRYGLTEVFPILIEKIGRSRIVLILH